MNDEYTTSNINQNINQKKAMQKVCITLLPKQIQTAKVSVSGSWNKQIFMINEEMWWVFLAFRMVNIWRKLSGTVIQSNEMMCPDSSLTWFPCSKTGILVVCFHIL